MRVFGSKLICPSSTMISCKEFLSALINFCTTYPLLHYGKHVFWHKTNLDSWINTQAQELPILTRLMCRRGRTWKAAGLFF